MKSSEFSYDVLMTPRDYAETVVLPTVREFLAERGDLRRAILSCVTSYHLIDHLAHAQRSAHTGKRASKKEREAEAEKIRDKLRSVCASSFEVVQGICNGTKHADLVPMQHVPVFAFDVSGAGWDQGRWDVPGLQVEHNGEKLFIDWCLQALLLTLRANYGPLLDALDLTFCDAAFRGQAGWNEA